MLLLGSIDQLGPRFRSSCLFLDAFTPMFALYAPNLPDRAVNPDVYPGVVESRLLPAVYPPSKK